MGRFERKRMGKNNSRLRLDSYFWQEFTRSGRIRNRQKAQMSLHMYEPVPSTSGLSVTRPDKKNADAVNHFSFTSPVSRNAVLPATWCLCSWPLFSPLALPTRSCMAQHGPSKRARQEEGGGGAPNSASPNGASWAAVLRKYQGASSFAAESQPCS